MDISKNTCRKRIRNKEEFVEHILKKASAIVERNPKLYIYKKIKKLEAFEKSFSIEDSKLDTLIENLYNIKERAEKEVANIDIVNSKIKENLLKALNVTDKPKKQKKVVVKDENS